MTTPVDHDRLAVIERQLAALTEQLARPAVRWLTVEGAADYASLSLASVRRLISSGRLRAHRPCKGRVLIDRVELDSTIACATGPIRSGRGIRRARPRLSAGGSAA